MAELSKPKQTGSVQDYQDKFDEWSARFNLSEHHKLYCFLSGLQSDFEAAVRMFYPTSVRHAFLIARFHEQILKEDAAVSGQMMQTKNQFLGEHSDSIDEEESLCADDHMMEDHGFSISCGLDELQTIDTDLYLTEMKNNGEIESYTKDISDHSITFKHSGYIFTDVIGGLNHVAFDFCNLDDVSNMVKANNIVEKWKASSESICYRNVLSDYDFVEKEQLHHHLTAEIEGMHYEDENHNAAARNKQPCPDSSKMDEPGDVHHHQIKESERLRHASDIKVCDTLEVINTYIEVPKLPPWLEHDESCSVCNRMAWEIQLTTILGQLLEIVNTYHDRESTYCFYLNLVKFLHQENHLRTVSSAMLGNAICIRNQATHLQRAKSEISPLKQPTDVLVPHCYVDELFWSLRLHEILYALNWRKILRHSLNFVHGVRPHTIYSLHLNKGFRKLLLHNVTLLHKLNISLRVVVIVLQLNSHMIILTCLHLKFHLALVGEFVFKRKVSPAIFSLRLMEGDTTYMVMKACITTDVSNASKFNYNHPKCRSISACMCRLPRFTDISSWKQASDVLTVDMD